MACNSVAVATAKVGIQVNRQQLHKFFAEMSKLTGQKMHVVEAWLDGYNEHMVIMHVEQGYQHGYLYIDAKTGSISAEYFQDERVRDEALAWVKAQIITLQQTLLLAALQQAGVDIQAAQQVDGTLFAKILVR